MRAGVHVYGAKPPVVSNRMGGRCPTRAHPGGAGRLATIGAGAAP